MMKQRKDLERLENILNKVKNPPEGQGGPGGPSSSDSTAIFMRDKYQATHPSWKAIADSAQKKYNIDPSKVDLPSRVLDGHSMSELLSDREKGMEKYGIKDSDFEE